MRCRFAAKEAVIKAHPHLRLSFHQIVISRRRLNNVRRDGEVEADLATPEVDGASGPPVAIVHRGEDTSGLAQEAVVSISHDGEYATAVCLGFEAADVPG